MTSMTTEAGALGRRRARAKTALAVTAATCAMIVGPGTALDAAAQTIQEALVLAYSTNPDLVSARAGLRATDENVAQARGGWRPQVEGDISQGVNYSDNNLATTSNTEFPTNLGITVTQPLYRFGRTSAAVRQAEAGVDAEQFALLNTEQQVLLEAASVFLDVVRDQATVELNQNNEEVLARQLEASEDRFRVGEITRTDVSQAESRLAGALAERINAEGVLNSSRSAFRRVIGEAPGILEQPEFVYILPEDLDSAIEISLADNPQVRAAQFQEIAARENVTGLRAELLPDFALVASFDKNFDSSPTIRESSSGTITGRITIPLYQAGIAGSQIRQANQLASELRIEIETARRAVRDATVSAWELLTAAQAARRAIMTQVRAAEIALDGVRQEAAVGSRTTLDILDAEQELLDAQVSLVDSDRDVQVVSYQLLAAVGRMTAEYLELPVELYDPDVHRRAARRRFWDYDIDE